MAATRQPMINSIGRNPRFSAIRIAHVIDPVTTMPASNGRWKSSDKPIAPPRNSARSVAIAAISLIPHIA